MSCTLQQVGVTGAGKKINGMCILSQNIINEKIYLALWFWYMFLFMMCGLQFFYYIIIIAVPGLKSRMISQSRNNHEGGSLSLFLKEDCDIGDWFLLNQIRKNVNGCFFETFLAEIVFLSNGGRSNSTLNLRKDTDC